MGKWNVRFDAHANYADPNEFEEFEEAIYLSIDAQVPEFPWSKTGEKLYAYAAISPDEAREFARVLIEQADAYDEREKARQDAKKYPTEDGWYLVGNKTYQLYDGGWFDGGVLDPWHVKSRIDLYGYKKMTVEEA